MVLKMFEFGSLFGCVMVWMQVMLFIFFFKNLKLSVMLSD